MPWSLKPKLTIWCSPAILPKSPHHRPMRWLYCATGRSFQNGPTATIRSVARVDHLKVLNGTLFNQKFNPHCLQGESDFEKMAALIRSYFAAGGHHNQFNMVQAETLLAAQREPEAYKGLIVRVAWYSVFFNELTLEVQDEIIQRTEQSW